METYGLTHPGNRRETNEDAVLINDNIGLLVLADGMGGHAAGDVASQIAVEVINDALEAALADVGPSEDESYYVGSLRAAIRRANAAIHEQGQSEASTRGMGSTAVAVLIVGLRLYVAHVGDSRCYLYDDGKFTQITRDHSKVQELVDAGQLTADEARNHALSNLLTRSLGPYAEVEVDVTTHDWNETRLLLLCSDGLNSELSDAQIRQSLETYADIKDKCRALVGQALEGRANDNVSLLIGQGERFAPQAKQAPEKLVDLTPDHEVNDESRTGTPAPATNRTPAPAAGPQDEPEPEFTPRPGSRRGLQLPKTLLGSARRPTSRLQIALIAGAIVLVLIALLLIPIFCDDSGSPATGADQQGQTTSDAQAGPTHYYLLFKDDALSMAQGSSPESAAAIEGSDVLVWDNISLVIRGRGFTPSQGGLFFKSLDTMPQLTQEALQIYSSVIAHALSLKTADGLVLAFTTLIAVKQNPLLTRIDSQAVHRLELETFSKSLPVIDEVLKSEYEIGSAWIRRTDRIFELADHAFELEGERMGQYRSRKGDYHYYQGLYYASQNINDRALLKFQDARQLGTSFPDVGAKIEELESQSSN
ncbi:MAG: Stp1/IreP family PP2C-type Ser/Thr phosphatase [Candidatus Alcyoniella australis]|nr:Stp1/IreP family PP2C-type Ser/Thr phosphatase [Candidatus Alcyoniella australis]